jgi:para-nitrobenzyl esterase
VEVTYVFGNFGGPGGVPRPEDLALSEMIQAYWINFAETGDPNGPGLPDWPNFTEDDQNVLYFDSSASVKPITNLEKLKAFDSYYSWR